jgi:hypothetical protein
VAESLAAHLAALPAPQLARVALRVLGASLASRALTERALVQRLLDPVWVEHTLDRLGPGAERALAALLQAGVPVLRRDVAALVGSPDTDPIESLEDHGLIVPVRTGRGMPTHVAIAPELEALVRARIDGAPATAEGAGEALAGTRHRFELALMVATLAQHPPRMTREGRLHARDLNALAELLDPLGHRAAALEQRLARWHEVGALSPDEGRLYVVPSAVLDIPALQQRIALSEIAAPSLPDGVIDVLRILLQSGGALPLRRVLETVQASLLRDRAEEAESALKQGARRELMDVMRALLAMEALVLLDERGQAVLGGGQDLLERTTAGESFAIGLDPVITAALRDEPAPMLVTTAGHVQSSFEIVADISCDPSLIARIGLFARVVRADRAAVLQLERAAVERGKALGVSLSSLLEALAALSGRPVPANVVTVLRDWYGSVTASLALPSTADPGPLRAAALAALALTE